MSKSNKIPSFSLISDYEKVEQEKESKTVLVKTIIKSGQKLKKTNENTIENKDTIPDDIKSIKCYGCHYEIDISTEEKVKELNNAIFCPNKECGKAIFCYPREMCKTCNKRLHLIDEKNETSWGSANSRHKYKGKCSGCYKQWLAVKDTRFDCYECEHDFDIGVKHRSSFYSRDLCLECFSDVQYSAVCVHCNVRKEHNDLKILFDEDDEYLGYQYACKKDCTANPT